VGEVSYVSVGGVNYVLAQVNFGRLLAPLDSPLVADFVAALEPVNAVADAAPGFVWRLQTEDGNATAVGGFEEDAVDADGSGGGILINMSVWESVEALGAYVYSDAHVAVLRRRREWFSRQPGRLDLSGLGFRINRAGRRGRLRRSPRCTRRSPCCCW